LPADIHVSGRAARRSIGIDTETKEQSSTPETFRFYRISHSTSKEAINGRIRYIRDRSSSLLKNPLAMTRVY
jgi:hypothetical protein